MAKAGRPLKVDPRIDRAFIDIEKGNNESVIKLLKEMGVDAFDRYKRTVLINAAFSGNLELMEWCLDNKANINHRDNGGMSALHFAAQEGRPDVAKHLVKKGAELDIKDAQGKSPFLTALLNWNGGKNKPMIIFLLESGADPFLKNDYKVSPFDVMSDELKKLIKKTKK
jgi:ankyrin repeat protein